MSPYLHRSNEIQNNNGIIDGIANNYQNRRDHQRCKLSSQKCIYAIRRYNSVYDRKQWPHSKIDLETQSEIAENDQ
jgi:hypothetical protein